MKRKLLPILLALFMVMSLLPASALAAEVIPSAAITIDAPVIGARPDYTAEFPSGAHYYSDAYNIINMRNDIGWIDLTEDSVMNPDGDVFQEGHQYQVYIYLTAQEGYGFTGSTTAAVNGQNAVTYMFGGQLEVSFIFPAPTAPEPVFSVSAPADKALEPTGAKQEIGKPNYTVDSTVAYISLGVRHTTLKSGDNSIGLTISAIRQSNNEEIIFDPGTGSNQESSGMPIIYHNVDSPEYSAGRSLTMYAQADVDDLEGAAPGAYTATLTYLFLIDPIAGNSITVERTQTLTLVVPEPPVTEYPLWLGNTRVTDENKDDILGDQTASFDPETNTLTFTTETPDITGLHEDALIYADGIDLTIKAADKLTLVNTVDWGDCVVAYNGALTINGDVDVTGDFYGLRGSSVTVNGDVKATCRVDGIYSDTGDITVNGNVTVTSADYGLYTDEGDIVVTGNVVSNAKGVSIRSYGNAIIGGSLTVSGATKTESYWSSVYVRNDLTVGGNVKVENEVPYDLGIYSYGKVTVVSGRWEAEGNLFAIWAEDGIEIPETHGIVTPENGQVGEATNMLNMAGYSVYAEDGETIAKHAVIEKIRNIKGDVSGDGIVDNRDLILIARYLVHLVEFNDVQLAAADWNGDGKINNSDLVQIARYIVSEQP